MELVTIDILSAIINAMKYADTDKYNFIKKRAVVSHMLSKQHNEEFAYPTFMAALLKDIGDMGYCINNNCTNIKVNYNSTEIIRTMPDIFPFQYKIADIVLESDEKIDGSGYPAGKQKISKEAQIIGISEDFINNENKIEKIRNLKARYDLDIIDVLEKFSKDEINLINNSDFIEKEFNLELDRYNVYKNEIYGVEEEQFLNTIASLIDAKHQYTAGHTKRVATYSYEIAKFLGYEGEKLSEVRHSAYLHDIGKLGIDTKILDKPGKLSVVEYSEIKNHARYSYEILEDSPKLKKFAIGALHHERIDGRGYPFGLKGDDIPEIAKIIAIADILDAITSNRPYRKPFTFKEAFALMDTMAGKAIEKHIFEQAKYVFNVE